MAYLIISFFTQRIVQDSSVFKKERKTKRISIPFVFGRRLEIYINLLASQPGRFLFTTSIARLSKSENHPLTFSNCLFTQKTPTRKFKMPDFPSIDEVLESAKNPSCSSSEPSDKEKSKMPDFPSIDEVLDSAKDPLLSSSEPSTRVAFAMDSNTDPKSASNLLTKEKPSQHLSVPENSSTQQCEDISDDRSLFEEKSGEGK